jgi:hypothetical protein
MNVDEYVWHCNNLWACVYFIVHDLALRGHDLVTFFIEDGSNRLA